MHLKKLLAFVVVLELAMAIVAAAQETTGTIAGRLVDAQGLAVPGVTITVTGPQGARTTVTDAEGRYSMPFLVPATYNVKAEITGFKTVEQREVQVQLGRTADVSATLQIAGAAEAISVTGAATLIDPESTTIGANIQSEVLQQIPIGRRFSDTAVSRARRQFERDRRRRQPVRVRRVRPRELVHRRRREHYEYRLRRASGRIRSRSDRLATAHRTTSCRKSR
jgi:predicted thioesterase